MEDEIKVEQSTQNYKLLIVDDLNNNARMIGHFLKEHGLGFILAKTSEQAIELAEKEHPHLILLDNNLATIDAYKLCDELKSNSKTIEIPIIFLSSKLETNDIVRAFDCGAVDYVTKPFRPMVLIARLYTHLELKRSKELLMEQNAQLESYIEELKFTRNLSEEYANKVIDLVSELEYSEEQLKASNDAKDKFFSIMAHDLKNPIGAFMNLSELLTTYFDTFSPVEVQEMVKEVYNSSKRLLNLLENLLEWARLQTGSVSFQPQKNDLVYVANTTIELLSLNASNKKIELINNVKPNQYVFADENMLFTVIRNLITNSIKFTPEGGKITVSSLKRDDNMVEISVQDTGLGISDDIMQKLFRIDATIKSVGTANEKGTGLGLILCKEFIEKNGGIIGVNSKLGEGSTFYFTLPIADN